MLPQILLRPRPGHHLGTISTVFHDPVANLSFIRLDYRGQNFCKLFIYAAVLAQLVNASVQDFVRQPSEEEWARLSTYARRMRCLVDHRSDFPSDAALELLNTRFSGRCMLPNLQIIRWIAASPKHLEQMLPLIVSPTLTEFRLGLNVPDPLDALQLVPFLEALAPAYGSLVGIRICDPTIHDPQTIRAASALLLKCNPNKLRYFHVDSALSTEAFIHATQLPNLEEFVIRADATEPSIPLPTLMFPSLTSLEINTTDSRSPLLQTITRIQSTTFTTLGLEFSADTVGTFLPMALTALRPRGLHETLTSLSITPDGIFDLDGATIQPLLFLSQLTLLEISLLCDHGRCPFKLSDGDLEGLVKAMPKLTLLSLGPIPCSHPANSTMKSLVSIAKHCKYLEELIIHTNIEAIVTGVFECGEWDDRPPDDPLPTFVGCPLHSIIFGPCFIPGEQRGAMIFALTLLRLFPRLIAVAAFHGTPERDPQWELMDGVIVADRRIRVNVADAGRFTSLLPYKNLAHAPQQPLTWRSTKACTCLLFPRLPISWINFVLYPGHI